MVIKALGNLAEYHQPCWQVSTRVSIFGWHSRGKFDRGSDRYHAIDKAALNAAVPGNQSRLSRCVYQETRLKLAPLAGVHKIETPPAVVDWFEVRLCSSPNCCPGRFGMVGQGLIEAPSIQVPAGAERRQVAVREEGSPDTQILQQATNPRRQDLSGTRKVVAALLDDQNGEIAVSV